MVLHKKIETSFDNIIFDEIYGTERFRIGDFFIEFDNSLTTEQLIDRVSDKIEFGIMPNKTTLTQITHPGVPMHIDAWPVSLNYYFSISNGLTRFYQLKDGYDPAEEIGKHNRFDREKYQVIDTFNPGKNELHLFNASVPHDVTIPESSESRYIFRFIWSGDYQFDRIAESITVK